ncbi:hypothetical protein [Saccharopolyspora mangrovi]|uniref:Uncharacterized protein n=1 Tax=Saccharopolyspora mangrovi TaxID=3082379 RepID=A0ABU6ADZ6_9PSEU|nr:hypothetical protein [Saccharopolyspora sp. S2-29]MEB3369676.1 hypothetical protein [Saccharopolyspora sp. S2-29]
MNEAEAVTGNRANWDERADIHVRSEMYDVEGFLADPTKISERSGAGSPRRSA